MHPKDLPNHYFSSVRTRDINRFIALFAEDAIMILPDGREVMGAAAIREMELAVFAASPPNADTGCHCRRRAFRCGGNRRALAERPVKFANFFHLNAEGRIQRLSVYRKSG
jgi:ketosteroid isomerase-like protein